MLNEEPTWADEELVREGSRLPVGAGIVAYGHEAATVVDAREHIAANPNLAGSPTCGGVFRYYGALYVACRMGNGNLTDRRVGCVELVPPPLSFPSELERLNHKFPVGARVVSRHSSAATVVDAAGSDQRIRGSHLGAIFEGTGGNLYVAVRWDDGSNGNQREDGLIVTDCRRNR